MPTRHLTFAGSSLAIEYQGQRASQLVDFLYGGVPVAAVPAAAPHPPRLTYHLREDTSTLHLYRDETLLGQADSMATMAEILLGDSCHQLAAHSQHGLLFHAAALAWGHQGLIIPGQSGAGKTTLTAWLISQGFDYLSDELTFIAADTTHIQAFPRPLNLKASARPIVQSFFALEAHQDALLRSDQADLIPPTLLKPDNTFSTPPLSLIIFPSYHPQHQLEVQALSKAQAGLALLQTLVNARNLPEHGFPQITRLVQHAPAYKISYNHFDQLQGKVESLFL